MKITKAPTGNPAEYIVSHDGKTVFGPASRKFCKKWLDIKTVKDKVEYLLTFANPVDGPNLFGYFLGYVEGEIKTNGNINRAAFITAIDKTTARALDWQKPRPIQWSVAVTPRLSCQCGWTGTIHDVAVVRVVKSGQVPVCPACGVDVA
jgi:hypothetical protein